MAILGCGRIGEKRAAALPRESDLTSVYDLTNARARNLAERYGRNTRVETDVEVCSLE
jgi:predicted dehydrogenase